MKLSYRVLWFDDTSEFFDSLDLDFLRDGIHGWGFLPEIKFVTTPREFLDASHGDYDLLVVDFNLEDHGKGQDFIAQVREQRIFTEVLFYSSAQVGQLWTAIHHRRLEGVYVAGRDTVLTRILQVGRHTIHKILDVENMRGIVMAEVGNLDLTLASILEKAISGLEEKDRADLFQRFIDATTEFHRTQQESLEKFKNAPSIELLLLLCDSNKRWQNYCRARRTHQAIKDIEMGDYARDVLTPRNFLAHGVPSVHPDGGFEFEHHGKKYRFDHAIGTALRMKIIEYGRHFDAALTALG